MSKIAENFIDHFHALDGITIADKRKNFFKLVHQNSSILKDNPYSLELICVNLKPKTFLEELFKLDFLIYFQRSQDLFQLLKTGNDVFISKIIKHKWFFENFFQKIGAREIVNDILPNVSFSVRMKILGKLSRYTDSAKFDKIFDAVAERYGIFIASKFTYGCSPKKIKGILKEYSIKLSASQLMLLYHKDPDLIEFYFTHKTYDQSYKNFTNFIFIENRHMYNDLQRKFGLNRKFGRRATKKFVDEERDDILQNPDKFRHLNFKAVLRKLGKESKILFLNALPKNFQNLNQIEWLLYYFPKKYYYNLYIKLVESHYNIRYLDHPNLIDEEFLELISENEERALYAKVNVDGRDDEFIKYLEIQDSIPLIKEKINFTSDIQGRRSLIGELVETCHINKDLEALTLVMKYFNFRHKNDDLEVHLQFIRDIENLFGFANFTEEMWNLLNDLLLVHMLKYDKSLSSYQKIQTLPLVNFNLGTSEEQKLAYLNFLFGKGEPIDDLLTDYFTEDSSFPKWGHFSKQFEKYFLIFAINRGALEEKLEENVNYNCSLINYIHKWNLHYREDVLSFYDFPSLVNTFNYVIKNSSYCNDEIKQEFRGKIFATTSNERNDNYIDIHWKDFSVYGKSVDLIWFLKYEPYTIFKYFSSFLDITLNLPSKKQIKLWHFIKKLTHLELDKRIKDWLISKLSDGSDFKCNSKYVTCLSILMPPKDYVTFSAHYKPIKTTLDTKDKNEVRLYRLRRFIASNFKNVKSFEIFSSLLDYCVGDYFKYAITSLYSILYKAPENILPQYFLLLSNKTVSVRKHVLYLTLELGTTPSRQDFLKFLSKTERVYSIQRKIFLSTLKYFIKNPNKQFFELVKMGMLFIKGNDYEMLKILVYSLTALKIPRKYRALYIEYTWKYFEKNVKIWQELRLLKESLLSAMDSRICKEIPLEFGLDIIERHYLTEEKTFNFGTFLFTFVSSRDENADILDKVFKKLEPYERQECLKFFRSWYQPAMSHKTDISYLNPFIKYYQKQIHIEEDFEDYIKIFFLKMKKDLAGQGRLDEVSERIYDFLKILTCNYGPYIIPLFGVELKNAFSYLADANVTIFHYYQNLICNYPETDVAVLILRFIWQPSDKNQIIFNEILQEIKNIEDKCVQIILNIHFKKYLASEDFLGGEAVNR